MKILWEDATTMDDNPASVEMHNGNIILNRDVFPKYSKFTQKFILEHEKGHYLIPTDSEEEADFYALKKVYKSTGKSLKKTMKAITDFLPESNTRVTTMYIRCLELDARDNGNAKAQTELNNLKGEYTMSIKQTGMQSPFVKRNATGRRRADGGEGINEDVDTPAVTVNDTTSRKMYNIVGFQMTIFEILFVLFMIIFLAKK